MRIFKQTKPIRGDFTTIVAVVADARPQGLHSDFVETNDPNALNGLAHIDTCAGIRRYGYL